ncbi:hypothetical protein V6Z11_D06G004500 [Gossypium hirsutum]|uniref:Uncharacterized protein n=1 Tax=Gossypium hirsutum TaxID=3635 RepID=A0ABM3A7E7_GOSHI|nr:uncharacterized protein LOC121218138 [Gossypium hirsutum]
MEEKPRRRGHGQLREEEPPLPAIDHRTGRRTPATTTPFAVAGKPKKAPFFSFLRIESRSGVRKAEIRAKRAKIERDLSVPPSPETGAAKGMVVADSMGEWEWCWWQTTWENGKRQVGV